MTENCDCDSLNNYHSVCGIHKDKKDFSATFALVLAMLSVVNSLHLKGKREYLHDVQIDNKTAKTVFVNCKLLNVSFSNEYLLPRTGVYAGYAIVDGKRYEAMINIGTNPTFHDIDHMSLEAHLFHYHGDLYDKYICVEFLKYMRPEKTFRSKDNLVLQLDQDMRDIENYFGTLNNG